MNVSWLARDLSRESECSRYNECCCSRIIYLIFRKFSLAFGIPLLSDCQQSITSVGTLMICKRHFVSTEVQVKVFSDFILEWFCLGKKQHIEMRPWLCGYTCFESAISFLVLESNVLSADTWSLFTRFTIWPHGAAVVRFTSIIGPHWVVNRHVSFMRPWENEKLKVLLSVPNNLSGENGIAWCPKRVYGNFTSCQGSFYTWRIFRMG